MVLETMAVYHQQQRTRRKLRKSLTDDGDLSSTDRARGDGAPASVSCFCKAEDDHEPFWDEGGTGDTGDAHRASAEAIKDAFRIEYQELHQCLEEYAQYRRGHQGRLRRGHQGLSVDACLKGLNGVLDIVECLKIS